jgi:hypothetical protein
MKRGDIVICITDEMYGQKQPINIGEQYIVVDIIEMSERHRQVQICDKNKKEYGLYDDRHFIPLNVWREFQLRKVLN